MVRLLVDQKIAVNAMTSLEGNALYYLCCYNENSLVEVMRLLLDAGIDVNKKTNENWSSLLALSSEQANHPDFIDAVKLLIEKRVELNATDDRRRNALINMCSKFNYKGNRLSEIIQLFFNHGHGIHLNHVDSDGKNILHHFCESYPLDKLTEIFKIFRGKMVLNGKAKDNFGREPHYYADRRT